MPLGFRFAKLVAAFPNHQNPLYEDSKSTRQYLLVSLAKIPTLLEPSNTIRRGTKAESMSEFTATFVTTDTNVVSHLTPTEFKDFMGKLEQNQNAKGIYLPTGFQGCAWV